LTGIVRHRRQRANSARHGRGAGELNQHPSSLAALALQDGGDKFEVPPQAASKDAEAERHLNFGEPPAASRRVARSLESI
jgi:hypothetical protein